jgi:hypothetical protein
LKLRSQELNGEKRATAQGNNKPIERGGNDNIDSDNDEGDDVAIDNDDGDIDDGNDDDDDGNDNEN